VSRSIQTKPLWLPKGRRGVPEEPNLPQPKPLCMTGALVPKSALQQGRICGLEKPGFPIPSLPAKDAGPRLLEGFVARLTRLFTRHNAVQSCGVTLLRSALK
jgi:hypothetical protein